MTALRCPVWARFSVGMMPPAGVQPTPPPRDVSPESLSAPVALWRWPDWEGPDDESLAAFAAWHAGKMPMFLFASHVGWPSQVPLLLDHRRPPVGVFNTDTIQIDGQSFSVRGWAEPEYFTELLARPFLSPGIRSEVLRFNEVGTIRFVDVVEAPVAELSAVAEPLLEGTAFAVGAPQRVPNGEFFELTPAADRWRAA